MKTDGYCSTDDASADHAAGGRAEVHAHQLAPRVLRHQDRPALQDVWLGRIGHGNRDRALRVAAQHSRRDGEDTVSRLWHHFFMATAQEKFRHPSDFDLYGGIADANMKLDVFELSPEVSLRSTYAHIMAPYILAFKRPEMHRPHPGPWKPASGGLGFDIEIEVSIPLGDRPTNFTRLNTIWWIAALLRLYQPCPLRVPIVSSCAFAAAATAEREPAFWPVEMGQRRLALTKRVERTLHLDTLTWLKQHWQNAVVLMDTPSFNAAFQAFDQAGWSNTISSAVLMMWAAIEALLRPGSEDIGRSLSRCIATYLEPPGPRRDKLFTKARDLYQLRGCTAHAAVEATAETASETFGIGRLCFVRAFEKQALPNAKTLLDCWKAGQIAT